MSEEDSLLAIEYELYEKPVEAQTSNNTQQNTTQNNTQSPPPANVTYTYHKVRSGETLGTIASRYGTTVSAIQRLNGLRTTRIYIGQRLKVNGKAKSTQTTTTNTTTKKYYSVRSGDTFGKIAQRHGKTINQLKRLNPGINIDRLSIGQRIRVR